jgi:hypothetical protein
MYDPGQGKLTLKQWTLDHLRPLEREAVARVGEIAGLGPVVVLSKR